MGHHPQSIFRRPVVRPARADSIRGTLPVLTLSAAMRCSPLGNGNCNGAWDCTVNASLRGAGLGKTKCLLSVRVHGRDPHQSFLANPECLCLGWPLPHGEHPRRTAGQSWTCARRYSPPVLIAVVAMHLLFGGAAAFWVVSKYSASRKLTFNAGPKSPNPSERALEHRIQLQKKMQSVSAPPAVPKRVLTTGFAKVTLPPLPEIRTTETAPHTMMSAGGAGAAFGATGAASLGGGGREWQDDQLLRHPRYQHQRGDHDRCLGFDVYAHRRCLWPQARQARKGSEFSGHSRRGDQARAKSHPANPLRDRPLVRRAYSWKAELIFATEENKQAAIAHIQGEVDYKNGKPKPGKPGGTRHDYALAEAFSLKPETIYMLTDGNATESQVGGGLRPIPPQEIYRVAEEGQKKLIKKDRPDPGIP